MASKCPKCDKTVYFGECWAGPAPAALRGQPPAAEPRAPPRDARSRDARPRARSASLPTRVQPEGGAGRGRGSHARTPQRPAGPGGGARSSQDEAGLGVTLGIHRRGAGRCRAGRTHAVGASRALLLFTALPRGHVAGTAWPGAVTSPPQPPPRPLPTPGRPDMGSVWTQSMRGRPWPLNSCVSQRAPLLGASFPQDFPVGGVG